MYSQVDSNYALFSRARVSYGTNTTVRYLDDPYDRIWVPADVGSGLATVTSHEPIINVDIDDDPPEAVLPNAVTTSSSSQYIVLSPSLPAKEVPIYMTMYFSEVTALDTTQNRSFRLYTDNKPDSDPIVPPYGGVVEWTVTNMTASANTSFKLEATADSTLPPLINAMEIFYVSDPLTDGTNGKDVEGLDALQNGFTGLQDWYGDPCLPSPYAWDWVNCSSDAIPRVTAFGFDLSGLLPDFSSMDALETIDLHNNSIIGPIPDFLGTLPNLKELNLANNGFSGGIPTSISRNNKLKLLVSGNPDLCVSDKSCQTTSTGTGSSSGSGKKSSKLPAILGSTIPTFFIFWAIVGIFVVSHQKKKTAAIAAVTTGHAGGDNRPNGTPQAQGSAVNAMMGKFGEAVMNEIKVAIQEQVTTEISNQLDPESQQGHQDGRNNI